MRHRSPPATPTLTATSLVALIGLVGFIALVPPDASAQESSSETGLEIGALPAVNFDSDEGFGYGVIAELYQYGEGGREPYVWTVQPTVFLTTKGRRDVTVFFDAPHVLPGGWRMTVFAGRQKQIATPYYGLGNATAYDESLEADDGPNPFYYRFGLTRTSFNVDLQRWVGDDIPARFLIGTGMQRATVKPVPEDDGTTLYAMEHGTGEDKAWLNYVRAGLVWDTRERETGPTSGAWSELVIRRTEQALAADVSFTRISFIDRRYFSLTDDLVFAHRYLVQDVTAGAPDFELFRIQSSFKGAEGLGGATTVRGIPRNRYVGRGMLVWNSELRWRVWDLRAFDRNFHVVLSAFLDQGRVWADGFDLGGVFDDLHRGYGGGVRVGMGENFLGAADVGTSSEAGLGLYLGLGYLY